MFNSSVQDYISSPLKSLKLLLGSVERQDMEKAAPPSFHQDAEDCSRGGDFQKSGEDGSGRSNWAAISRLAGKDSWTPLEPKRYNEA